MMLRPVQPLSVGDAVLAESGSRVCVVGFHRIIRNAYDGILLVPSLPNDRACAVVETAGALETGPGFLGWNEVTAKDLSWHWPWELQPDGRFDEDSAESLAKDWSRYAEFQDPRVVSARETPDVSRFALPLSPEHTLRMRAWRTAMQTTARVGGAPLPRRAPEPAAMRGAMPAANNVLTFRPRQPNGTVASTA